MHRKATTGEVFYVGKGKGDRYKSKAGRNSIWTRIATKHGFVTEIVENNLQEWYAFELENNLVNYYGRLDLKQGTLANMTDGGYDNQNFSAYVRKKIRVNRSGVKSKLADKQNYSFYNINTEETFYGTRMDFKDKYNIKYVKRLFATKFIVKPPSHHGWVVLDFCSEDRINELKQQSSRGILNPNADTKQYTFCNIESNTEFIGTRVDFYNKFKLT